MNEKPVQSGMNPREFIVFIAALMAINALGIDMMLPALPDIGHDFSITATNHRQWVITIYLLGFSAGQLIYGPMADRFGRRWTLVTALTGFVVATFLAAAAHTFALLLVARFLQGFVAAATRVVAVAVVRDRASGRQMARIMSIAQMIFFIVPLAAPTLGQGLLALGEWHIIFYVLGFYSAIVLTWSIFRLSETLPRELQRPISVSALGESYKFTLTERYSIGYTVAGMLTLGTMVAFLSSAQQIFVDEFGAGRHFTLLFGLCAIGMAIASFLNSSLVQYLGTRLISQSALLLLIGLSSIHLLVIYEGAETLSAFIIFQTLSMVCIGLCGANFGAIAMEPVGHIAGTAASLQGFITGTGAVVVGSIIGQSYAGTTIPLVCGNLIISTGVLVVIMITEGGQLFRRRLTAR